MVVRSAVDQRAHPSIVCSDKFAESRLWEQD
jgi:hypothetical protein